MEAEKRADRKEFRRTMTEEEWRKTVFIKGRQTDITETNPVRSKKKIEDLIERGFNILKSRDSFRIVCKKHDQKTKMLVKKPLLGRGIIHDTGCIIYSDIPYTVYPSHMPKVAPEMKRTQTELFIQRRGWHQRRRDDDCARYQGKENYKEKTRRENQNKTNDPP